MATVASEIPSPTVSPYLLADREALIGIDGAAAVSFSLGDLTIDIRPGGDSLWTLIRRGRDGGIALRAAHLPAAFECEKLEPEPGEAARLRLTSEMGEHLVVFRANGEELERLQVTVTLTPSAPLLLPFVPRDLYPLDRKGDPLGTEGTIEAIQRGINAGLLYFRLEKPAFGNVLYFQNLTGLNDYYRQTGTTPDGVVGGVWPELGYLMPTPQGSSPPGEPLPAGEAVTLSDVILVFRHQAPSDERESARQFLQMLGSAYKALDLPAVNFRDWVERAERTAADLQNAPEATISHYGHRYIHPYTAAEYPDIMVQMSIIAALHDWGKWRGEPHPLETELKAGIDKFYDGKLKTLRRYLPNVGDDKDADAVDSWYLYHPLLNLGILALDGDDHARKLFLKSVDYGIAAAHHFKYKWPIQYKVTDFSVITASAADGRGQTDVGGIYASVMLQAFELTDDKRFLDEARAAIDAALGLRFNLNYQANLTAWGAAACMRLWRITNRDVYLAQSYVYLASFFHNAVIWDSRIGHAAHYENFLGVTCLQDAPYMAVYECFDSFVAFERYLNDSGPDLEPAVRMLIAEYCKYALSRAWFYYPDALPEEAISDKQRETNGHIDRNLSFPLEDLYADGKEAGQVGQEVYGAGAAFIFATRAFHDFEGAPFRLFCDHFIRASDRVGDQALTITLDGGETCRATLRLIRMKRGKLPKVTVTTAGGDALRPADSSDNHIDYHVPANGRLTLSWRSA